MYCVFCSMSAFESIKASEGGRPLQIVQVDSQTIVVVEEALNELKANLDKHAHLPVAVVSVMGAYRTGKSFFLDLLLRHLNIVSGSSGSVGAAGGAAAVAGLEEKISGFSWRGGMDKCTEGIWVWSAPFVCRTQSGEEVALLLMDTQGAFDSQLSKSESSTIFGLTCALSSFLIYNVSKQIQEDTVDNLHFFLECAQAALRRLSAPEGKGFQHLRFLVRDWANFEEDWTREQCEVQMRSHLTQHLTKGKAAETINAMFSDVQAYLLTHPGLATTKPSWTGSPDDIDPKFTELVTGFFEELVTPKNLDPKSLMGKQVTAGGFPMLVKTFVDAFKGLVPEAENLAVAVAKSSHLISKDSAIEKFRTRVEEALEKAPRGLPEEKLQKTMDKIQSAVSEEFKTQTTFGPMEVREPIEGEFKKELGRLREGFVEDNKRRTEQALTVFSVILILILTLYVVDKSTDFTCDWYSESCVRFSNALFSVYSLLLAVILAQAFALYRERGQMLTLMALMEMGKGSVRLALEYVEELKLAFKDGFNAVELFHFVRRFFADVLHAIQPFVDSIKAYFPAASDEDEGKVSLIELTDLSNK